MAKKNTTDWFGFAWLTDDFVPPPNPPDEVQDNINQDTESASFAETEASKGVEMNPTTVLRSSETKSVSSVAVDIAASASSDSETHTLSEEKFSDAGNICDKRNIEIQLGSAASKFTPPTTPSKIIGFHSAIKQSPKSSCSVESSPINQCSVVIKKNPVLENLPRQSSYENVFAYVNDKIEIKNDHDFEKPVPRERKVSSSESESSITSIQRQNSVDKKADQMVYNADIEVRKSGRLKSAKCASRYRGDYGIRAEVYTKLTKKDTVENVKECTSIDATKDIISEMKKNVNSDHEEADKMSTGNGKPQIEWKGSIQNNSSSIKQNASQKNGKLQPQNDLKEPVKHQKSNKISFDKKMKDSKAVPETNVVVSEQNLKGKQETNFDYDYTLKKFEKDTKIGQCEKQVEQSVIQTRRSSARNASITQFKNKSNIHQKDSLGTQENSRQTNDTSYLKNTEIMVKEDLKGTDQNNTEKVSDKHVFQQGSDTGQTEKHFRSLMTPTKQTSTHKASLEVDERKSNTLGNITSDDKEKDGLGVDKKLKDTAAVNKKKVISKEQKEIQKQRKSDTCSSEFQGESNNLQTENQGKPLMIQTHRRSALNSDGTEAKLDVKDSEKNQEGDKLNIDKNLYILKTTDKVEINTHSEINKSEQNFCHPSESTMKDLDKKPNQAVINSKSKSVSKERSGQLVAPCVTKPTTTHLNEKLRQKRSVAILNQKNMHPKKKVGPILRTHLTLQAPTGEHEKDKDIRAEKILADITVCEQIKTDYTGTRQQSYIDSHVQIDRGSEAVALNDVSTGVDQDPKMNKRNSKFEKIMPLSENGEQKIVVCDKLQNVPSLTENKQDSTTMADPRKKTSSDSDLHKPHILNENIKCSQTPMCRVKKTTAGLCSSNKPETKANVGNYSYSVTKFYKNKDKNGEQNLVTEIKRDVPAKNITGIPVTTDLAINQSPVLDNSVSVLESLRLRLFASAGIKPVEVVDKPKVFESKIKQPKLKTSTNSDNSHYSQSCFQSGGETLLNNLNKATSDTEANKAGANSSKSSNRSGHSTPRSSSPSSEILDEVSKTLESLQKAKRRKDKCSVQKSIQPRFSQKMFMLRSMFPKHVESDSESHSSVTTEQSDDSLRDDKDGGLRNLKDSKHTDTKSAFKGTGKNKQKKVVTPSKGKCSTYSKTNVKSVQNVEKVVKSERISSKHEKNLARKQLVKQKPVKCHACGHVFKNKELLKKHYPCRMRQTRTWSQNKLRPNRVFRYVEKPVRDQGSKRFICLLPKSRKQDHNKSRPQLLTIRKTKFRRVKGKRRRKLYMILQELAGKRRPRTYPHLCINYENLTNKSQFLYKLGLIDPHLVDSSSLEDSFNSSVASLFPDSGQNDKGSECELMSQETQKDLNTDYEGRAPLSDTVLLGLNHTQQSFDDNRLSDFIDGKQKSLSAETLVPPVLEKFEAPDKAEIFPGKETATDSDSNGPPFLELQFDSPTKKTPKERHFLDFVDSIARKDSAIKTDGHNDLHPADFKLPSKENTEINDASYKSVGMTQRHFTDFIDIANMKSPEQEKKTLMNDSALWEQSERGEMTLAEIKEMLKPKSRKENAFSKETLLKLRSDLDKFLSGVKTPRKKEITATLPEKKQEFSEEKSGIENLGIDLSSYERKSLFETLENAEQHSFESQVSVDDGSCAESELSSTSEQQDTYKSSPEYEQDLLPHTYGESVSLESTTKGCITENILQMLSTLEDKGSVAENMTNLLQILAENLGITSSSNSNPEGVSQEDEDRYLVEDPIQGSENHQETYNANQDEVSKITDDCTQSSMLLEESVAENGFNLSPKLVGTNELNSSTELVREKIPEIVIQSQTELHLELPGQRVTDAKQHQKEGTEVKTWKESTLFKSITELNSIETDSDSNLGDSFDAVIMSKRLAELKATSYDASASDINSDMLSDLDVPEKSKQIDKDHRGLIRHELLVPERPVLCDSPTREPYESDILESEEEPSKVVEERPRLIMKIKIPAGASFEMSDDSSHKDSSSCTSASAKSSDASDIEDLGKSEEDTLVDAETEIESNINKTITAEEVKCVAKDQEVNEVMQGLNTEGVKNIISSDKQQVTEAEHSNDAVPEIEDLEMAKLNDGKVQSLKSDAEAISEKEIMFPRKLKLNTALTIGDSFDYESDSSSSFEREVTVTPHVGTSPKSANSTEMQFSGIGLKPVEKTCNNKGIIKDCIAEQIQVTEIGAEDHFKLPAEPVLGKYTDLSFGESDGTITNEITTDFQANPDPLLGNTDSSEIENHVYSTGETMVVSHNQLFESRTDGKEFEGFNCTEDSGKILQNLGTDTERLETKDKLTSYFNKQAEFIGTKNEEGNVGDKSDLANSDALTSTVTTENHLPVNDICTNDKINQEHVLINTNPDSDSVIEISTEVSLDSTKLDLALIDNVIAPKSFVPPPTPHSDLTLSTQSSLNNLCKLNPNFAVDSIGDSDKITFKDQFHKNKTETEIVKDSAKVVKVNAESVTHQEDNLTPSIKSCGHESQESSVQPISFLECKTQTNINEAFSSVAQKEIITVSENMSSAKDLNEHNQSFNKNVPVHHCPESVSVFKIDTLTVSESISTDKGANESKQGFDSNTSNMPFADSKIKVTGNVSKKSNIKCDITQAKYKDKKSTTDVTKHNVQDKVESSSQLEVSSSKTPNYTSSIGSDIPFSKKRSKDNKPKSVKKSIKETEYKISAKNVVKKKNHKAGLESKDDINADSKITSAGNKDDSDQIINENVVSELCNDSEIVKDNVANVPIPHVIADQKSQSQAKPIMKGSSVTDDNHELQNKKRRISVTDYLSRVKKGDKSKKNEEQKIPKVPFTLHDENKSSSEPTPEVRPETGAGSNPEIIVDENMYETNAVPVTWHNFGNTKKALKESSTMFKQPKNLNNKAESVLKDSGDTYKIFAVNEDRSMQGLDLFDKEATEKDRKSKRFVSMPLTKKSDIVTLEKSLNSADKEKSLVLTDTGGDSTNQYKESNEQDTQKADDDVLSVFDSLFSLGETVLSLNKSEPKLDDDKPLHAEEGSLFSALDTLCKVGEGIISSGKSTEEPDAGRSVNKKSEQTGFPNNQAKSFDTKPLIPEVIDLTETEDIQGSHRAYFLDLESWMSQSGDAKNIVSSQIPIENLTELPTNILEPAHCLDKLSGFSGIYLSRFRYNIFALENEYIHLQATVKEKNKKSVSDNNFAATSVAVVNVDTFNLAENQIVDTGKTEISNKAHTEDESPLEQENNDLIEGVNEDYMDDDYADMLAAAQLALHEEAKSQNVESCPAKSEDGLDIAKEIFTEKPGKAVTINEEASNKTSPDEALAILNSLVKTLSADIKEIPVGSPEISAKQCEMKMSESSEIFTEQIEEQSSEIIEPVSEEQQEMLIGNARSDSLQNDDDMGDDDMGDNVKKPQADEEVLKQNTETSFTENQEILVENFQAISGDTSKGQVKINDNSLLEEGQSVNESVKISQKTVFMKTVENFEQSEDSNNDTELFSVEGQEGEGKSTSDQNEHVCDQVDETVSVEKDADSVLNAHGTQDSENELSKNVETFSCEIRKEISECAELPDSGNEQTLNQHTKNSVTTSKIKENKENLVKQTNNKCSEESQKGLYEQDGTSSTEIEVSLETAKPLSSVNEEKMKETKQNKLSVNREDLCEDKKAGSEHNEEEVAIAAFKTKEASSQKDGIMSSDDTENMKANGNFANDNQDLIHTDFASLEKSKVPAGSQEIARTVASEVGQCESRGLYTKQDSLVSMDYDNVSDGSFSDEDNHVHKSEERKENEVHSVVSKRLDNKESRHTSSLLDEKSPLHVKQSRGRKYDDIAPIVSEDDRRNLSEDEDNETHKGRKKVGKERKSKSPEVQKYKYKGNDSKKNRRKNITADDYDTEDNSKNRKKRKKEKKKKRYSDSEESDYYAQEKHKKKRRSTQSPIKKVPGKQQYDEYYESKKDRKIRKSSEDKLNIKATDTHYEDYENERKTKIKSRKVVKSDESDDEKEIDKKKKRMGRKSSEDRTSRNASVAKDYKSEEEEKLKKPRQLIKVVESDDNEYHEKRQARKKKREHRTSFEDKCKDSPEAADYQRELENKKKNRKRNKAVERYDDAEFYESRKEKNTERRKHSEERKYLKSYARKNETPTEIETDEFKNVKQRKSNKVIDEYDHDSERMEMKNRKNKNYLETQHYKNPVYDNESKKEGRGKAVLENENYKYFECEKDRKKAIERKKSSESRSYEHEAIEQERKDVYRTKFTEGSDDDYNEAHNSRKKDVKSKDLFEMEYDDYYGSETKRKKNRKKRKSAESDDYKYVDNEDRKRRKLSEALDYDDYKSEKRKKKERKSTKSSDIEEYQYGSEKEKKKEGKNKKSKKKDKYYEDDKDRKDWKKSAYIYEEVSSSEEYSQSSKKGKMLQSAVVFASRDKSECLKSSVVDAKGHSYERDRSDRDTDKHGRKSNKCDRSEMKLSLKSKSSR